MAVELIQQRQFLELLAEKKRLPLRESVAVFRNRNGSLNAPDVAMILGWFSGLQILQVLHVESDEAVRIKEELFQSIGDYEVCFLGFANAERDLSKDHIGKILTPGFLKFGKREQFVETRAPRCLNIIGDRDGALILAERVRAFAHRFALNLVCGNTAEIQAAFATDVKGRYGLTALMEKLERLQKVDGPFGHFDHLYVNTVYSGQHAELETPSFIPLAGGMDPSLRRGQAEFSLTSVWTPSGVPLYECLIFLFVVEQDGELRLSGVSCST